MANSAGSKTLSGPNSLEPLGKKKLTRSVNQRMFGGVMGGLAQYLDMDVTLLRVIFVVGSFISVAFPGILVYIIMWLIIPEEEAY